jgi:acetolactate synthase-1/2/3 large subunit
MNVSDYIVEYLIGRGVTHGYFLIGGTLGWISDACYRKGLTLHTMHHEQAAAFAAEAQAAITKNIGLAMATSGPGATNLITGVASSYFGSYPVLFITGQVNTSESNISGKRRQVGFQETDIVSLVKPITKYSKKVISPNTIVYDLEKAIFIATNKRMGPTLLDIPIDVAKAEINLENIGHFIGSEEYRRLNDKTTISASILEKVVAELNNSKRPVILIGHGVKLSRAERNTKKLIEITNIPFVTSLLGTDSIPSSHPLCFGFIGTYGQRYSNFTLANADLILVLGARLDTRQIGVQSKMFAPVARIIHVDIDRTELGESVNEWLSIESDINDFLIELIPRLHSIKVNKRQEWTDYLKSLKGKYGKIKQNIEAEQIDPVEAIKLLSEKHKEGDIITVDVRSHQMWYAQGWISKSRQYILTNGGMAPMGCALPAAIGASLTRDKCPVLVVTGDGSLQINIQEFQTVVRNKLPVKIVVFNNNALGMLTQFQEENFEGRNVGSTPAGGYDSPDFVKVAKAYGLAADSVKIKSDLKRKINWLMRQKGPSLLDISIPVSYLVLPKSSYNRPVQDMAPFIDRDEYKKALKYIK